MVLKILVFNMFCLIFKLKNIRIIEIVIKRGKYLYSIFCIKYGMYFLKKKRYYIVCYIIIVFYCFFVRNLFF